MNQHSSIWSQYPEYEDVLLHLRDNEDKGWPEIGDILGVSRHQARSKYMRLKDAGRSASPDFEWDGVPVQRGCSECSGGQCSNVGDCVSAQYDDPYEVSDPYRSKDYLFVDGEYHFRINGKDYAFPEDIWQEIVTDYSEHGGRLTRQELALKYGGNYKVIEAALRKYGAFKATPPATREEIANVVRGEGDFEPLMDRAVEAAQRRFQNQLKDHKYRRMEADYRSMQQELQARGEIVEELRAVLSEVSEIVPKAAPVAKLGVTPTEDWHVFAPVYDAHIGLVTHADGHWTPDYNDDIACHFIREHSKEVVRRIRERGTRPSSVTLGLGGDMFHTIMGRTVSGNQRPTFPRSDRMHMRAAAAAIFEWIETVRPHTDTVVVKGIGGNHDGPLGGILVDIIALRYDESHDVVVDTTPGDRAYFVIGDTLHVLDHGESFKNVTGNKSLAFAERIARRVAGRDYYKVRRIVFYVGHMHHRESASNSTGKTQGHLELIRVPVFCTASDYEDMIGFWNEQMADVFFLSNTGRIKSIERVYAEEMNVPENAKKPEQEWAA